MTDDEALYFRKLFESEFAYVWNTLRRLGVAERERRDVAQEIFLVVHQKLGEFDRTRQLRAWLFGIAYRTALRHKSLVRHARETLSDVESTTDGDPLSLSLEKERADLVQSAILRIELHRRAVFVMSEIDGFSAPEIAEALQVPLNTVYSRLRLARQDFAEAVTSLLQEKERRA
jgi:RNA polymerase sigma-70 factor (ECF subfamily)